MVKTSVPIIFSLCIISNTTNGFQGSSIPTRLIAAPSRTRHQDLVRSSGKPNQIMMEVMKLRLDEMQSNDLQPTRFWQVLRTNKSISSKLKRMKIVIREAWWCFPMILAVFPLIGKNMPHWWSLKTFDHLRESAAGIALVSAFLLSNVVYFLGGAYLLDRIPSRRKIHETDTTDSLRRNRLTQHTSQDPLLGRSLVVCGTISFIYHLFQSFGSPSVAEFMCFIDHAFAISSILYFVKKCGLPSARTSLLSLASLKFLIFPGEVYPFHHSLWHLASASTSISWALDGVSKRKKFISETLNVKRSESKI